MDLDTYLQTAVSTEYTELLVLEMKHYERLFVRRHQQTVLAMRHLLELKYSRRLMMHDCEHLVPLLSYLNKKLKESHKKKTHSNKAMHGSSSFKSDIQITEMAPIKDIVSIQKKFLEHQGPIIDMYAPESVFYLIRLREKQRQKVKLRKSKYDSRWDLTFSEDEIISAKDNLPMKLQ